VDLTKYFFSKITSTPLLDLLAGTGLEVDQRMRQAITIASSVEGGVTSAHLFEALCRTNTRGCSAIPESSFAEAAKLTGAKKTFTIPKGGRRTGESVKYWGSDIEIEWLTKAVGFAIGGRSLGASHFLRAIVETLRKYPMEYVKRARASDILAHVLTGHPQGKVRGSTHLLRLQRALENSPDGTDDFQYVVALEDNRIVFRIASTLGDYVHEGDSGLWVPQRTLLMHLGRIGVFTQDEVEELESLMNDPGAKEQEYQDFFERHPHFLRKWDHREIYPHVALERADQGPLIPDFILTNTAAQDAAVLDIKRTLESPKKTMIRRQDNRVRFADAIQEACAQLRTYRRWFETPENRRMLKDRVRMEIYNPRLIVVIGRTAEFRDEIDRAILRSDNPDVEIVTYDDIAEYARDRMVFVEAKR